MTQPAHSLPCPYCGHFRGWPLTSVGAVEEHVRNVHGDNPTEWAASHREKTLLAARRWLAERDPNGRGQGQKPSAIATIPADMPSAPEGPCADCETPGRRVWVGDHEYCAGCARTRLRVRQSADREAA
jgi:hypothetical protein